MPFNRNEDGTVAAPLPPDEEQRLAALNRYCILDTGRDPRFDRITGLAGDVLGMPVVVISLVDQARQWFKSIVGSDVTEIDRSMGFCAHAIAEPGDGPMIVVDTLEDPRFAANPLVANEPKLRFYAGAPLIDLDGRKLGTLCVHDLRPRPDWTRAQSDLLARFAAIAMDEIAFHRTEHQRTLLVDELGHRISNVVAVISSIAELSGRNNAAAADYLVDFRGRLAAIATAHRRVVSDDWDRASAATVIEEVAAPHQGPTNDRIKLTIDSFAVSAQSAQTLALVVHELLTNAVKYGALSTPQGVVAISGKCAGEVGTFTWRESGGPTTRAPHKRGFGTLLLERLLAAQGGHAKLDWRAEGLAVDFSLQT